jgi:palmitoyltransferase ZDHHC9/14/18
MTTPTEPSAGTTPNASGPAIVTQDDQATRESTTAEANDTSPDTKTNAQPANLQQNRLSTGSRILAGITGPVGEPGLPPSRPSSIATSNSMGHRRGLPGLGNINTAGSVAGSMGSSRPTTSTSRTHVPLAAHGFFRPMSSQRLQQQRQVRPTSLLGHTSLYSDGATDFMGNPYRQSMGSNNTIREATATTSRRGRV